MDAKADRKATHHQRLAALRAELSRRGLDGFVVAHTDEHKSEYTPAYARRLAWLTGFDGSAGLAVVLQDAAALFVDGRYTLQARAQVNGEDYLFRHLIDDPAEEWIVEVASPGARIGYDPWLHGEPWVTKAEKTLGKHGIELVAVETNPIDAVWPDQPAPPPYEAVPHGETYAGESSASKRQRMAAEIAAAGADAAVITALDSIAWLLNIRGRDVEHTPLVLAFAILDKDGGVDLYIDPAKVTDRLRHHLGDAVRLHPKTDFAHGLAILGEGGKSVLVDPALASSAVIRTLDRAGATIIRKSDPCQLAKAIKNATEIAGARAAHKRDGVAVTRFLAWLAREAAHGGIDEIAAADKLEALRREGALFQGLSFDTISGAGPNGAIVHYRVTPETNRPLKPGELYLVDSGAQYLDGTTDVTRTVAIGGTPSAEQRDRFTRVLKGHIAIATARFPKGTTGAQLDVLARMPLWQVGLNYDHGTGHGVGSYLGVHEGPQGISRAYAKTPLQPGMIISNEPGFYKPGGYGIRIENLVLVQTAQSVESALELYEFETLTLAPIDLNLVERVLLTDAEANWLNAYHARVRDELTPHLDEETATWLASATRAI
ncbi:MAG: aminopeptidase P family protein [Alphaproteobacteria bacterium]|nr:MAG: aminopeptidase P family protein [Alphaproteobacteria bacterium]